VRPVDASDVERLVLLHREWFPVRYGDDFYSSLTHNPASHEPVFAMVAVRASDNEVVGAITAQIYKEWQVEDANLVSFSFSDQEVMYITTLGVIPEYRQRGIATRLLDTLLEFCNGARRSVKAAYLHVLTTNYVAIGFYEKHKFARLRVLRAYYEIEDSLQDSYLYILYLNNGRPPGYGNILEFCHGKVGQAHQFVTSVLNWFC